ncbi:MAG TPA: hypothetical protein VEU98_06660, partial [Candidatus Eremiobacteraceae bacterium]|nr:hypothetical protein [Candidatus Eremiobacteraceae bacterium]
MGWLSGLGKKSTKTVNDANSAFPANGSTNGRSANDHPESASTAAEPARPDMPVNEAKAGKRHDPAVNTTNGTEVGGENEATPAENSHTGSGNAKPVEKRNPKHN